MVEAGYEWSRVDRVCTEVRISDARLVEDEGGEREAGRDAANKTDWDRNILRMQ